MRALLRTMWAAAAVAVVLTGCAGAPGTRDIGIASRSYSGLPDGIDRLTEAGPVQTEDPPLVPVEPTDRASAPESEPSAPEAPGDAEATEESEAPALPEPDFSPHTLWLSEETLAVVTYGSSSCPAAPAALELAAGDTLDIVLKSTGGEVCTADLGPTTFEIDDPDGIDPATRYTVTFDGESESVLLPSP